jgi:hypothetical protein
MNIGVVLLIGTSNVAIDAAPALTGTKPEWIPATLASEAWMGWHGSANANADCVTV